MQNLLNTYLEKYKIERDRRRKLIAVLVILAIFVGIAVYWQMRMTGAAMTNEVYCGLEDHTHSDDCYEEVLICGLEESEDIYEEVPVEEESTEAPVEESQEEESEETSTEASQEENKEVATKKVLVQEGHTHTDDCYETQLTCEKEEHEHTIDCMVDETADVETASDWESTIPSLSGQGPADVVAVAKSQIGYRESEANFVLGDDGETRKGYTRYGAWYGNEYGDWDAMFAAFCLYYAGISESEFPQEGGASSWITSLKNNNLYVEPGDYTPMPGDLIFLEGGNSKRVGIVTEVSGDSIIAIEGNSSDSVEKTIYTNGSSSILGYGTLTVQEEENETEDSNDQEETEDSEDEEKTKTTAFSAETELVTAEVTLTEALPEDYSFEIEEMDTESKGYKNAMKQAEEYLEKLGYKAEASLALEMHFSDEEGNETEIDGSASVTLSFLKDEMNHVEDIKILHVTENGVEDVTDSYKASGKKSVLKEAELTTESFSPFIVYSVSGEEKQAEDLEAYIAKLNAVSGQSASLDFKLYNTDTTDVATDGNGNLVVREDTTYLLSLIIQSSAGFENGTYAYKMPAGVNAEDQTGPLTMTDGTVIGTWSVLTDDDGNAIFTVKVEQGDTEYSDVTIQFSAETTFTKQETTIQIGDQKIVFSDTTGFVLEKSGTNDVNTTGYETTNPGGQNNFYTGRRWNVTFSQSGVDLAGNYLVDVVSDGEWNAARYSKERGINTYWNSINGKSNDQSSYKNQQFDTSKPLRFVLTHVEEGNTYSYEWEVPWTDSNLQLYYSDGITNTVTTTPGEGSKVIGYTYTFPNQVSANVVGTGETITFDLTDTKNLERYTVNVYAYSLFDEVPSNSSIRKTYYNTAWVYNGTDSELVRNGVSQQLAGTSGQQLVKGWNRGADEISVDWNIKVTLPGNVNLSYQLQDFMRVTKDNNTTILESLDHPTHATNTVVTVDVPEGTTINGEPIEAGTYPMYKLTSGATVPNGTKFVYYTVDTTWTAVNYIFGMICSCDETHCSNHTDSGCGSVIATAEDGTKYCTCWQLSKAADINITYTTPQKQMVDMLSKYGNEGSRFYNNLNLYSGTKTGTGLSSLRDTHWMRGTSSFVGLTLSDKTLETIPSQENDFTAKYQIAINEDHHLLTLNDEDLVLNDQLSSSLTFVGNLNIVSTDKNDNQSALRQGEDYTYSYDASTHQLIINIKNPGTKSFKITYDAQMLNPQANLEYYNSVKLSWQGEDVEVTTDTGHVTNVSTSGVTYMISILKQDEITKTPLSGATFGLYDAGGKEMASASTKENGQVSFKTIAGASDNALTLRAHTLYYLQETEAPEGYILDNAKYYFYFCDKDGEECEDCSDLTENLPTGVSVNQIHKETTGSIVTITNEQQIYDFSIKKVDTADASKTLAGAEFYLYYESPILDADGNPTENMNRYYAILNDENELTGWNASTNQATRITSGTNGIVKVSGINAGTYYLEEVTAPDGYNLLSEVIQITISMDGTMTMEKHSGASLSQADDESYMITVMNSAGYSLPKTGGEGVMGYYLIGLLLCLAAIGLMAVSYRRTYFIK